MPENLWYRLNIKEAQRKSKGIVKETWNKNAGNRKRKKYEGTVKGVGFIIPSCLLYISFISRHISSYFHHTSLISFIFASFPFIFPSYKMESAYVSKGSTASCQKNGTSEPSKNTARTVEKQRVWQHFWTSTRPAGHPCGQMKMDTQIRGSVARHSCIGLGRNFTRRKIPTSWAPKHDLKRPTGPKKGLKTHF